MVTPRLPFLQPVESKRRERFVYSWDELVAAIGDYASTQVLATGGDLAPPAPPVNGRTIRFGESFTWKGVVTIPNQARGLIIDGGNFGITPKTDGMGMFALVSTSDMTFRNIVATGTVSLGWGTILAVSGSNNSNIRLVDSDVLCSRAFQLSATSRSTMSRTLVRTHGSPTKWVALSDSSSCSVIGNIFTNAAATKDIYLDGTCNDNVIAGNAMAGGGIQNAGAGGKNVVSSNANAGTITIASSDAAGLNT